MIAVAALIAGCSETKPHGMMEHKKPTPGPELAKLNRFVGNWTGTAEMVKPTLEDMKKMMPPGSPAPTSNKFAGGGRWEWTMDGLVLKSEGWHEMGPGEKANMVEYIGYDPKTGKYWSTFMSDWGDRGSGVMTASADGRSYTISATGFDGQGNPSKGNGTMRFVDDNTIEWTWEEQGAMGEMKLKGTSKRTM